MKTFIVAALFVSLALAAASDVHVHFHLDKPTTNKRFDGFVNQFVNSVINKNTNEVHFQITDDAIEDFSFKDLGNKIKDGFNKGIEEVGNLAGKVVDKIADKIGEITKDDLDKLGEAAKDGFNQFGDIAKDGIDQLGDIIKEGLHHVGKGFDITKEGIDIAIREAEQGLKKVRHEIENIKLPHITLPEALEITIKIAEIVEKLIPCALTLEKIFPDLLAFAKSAAEEDAGGAIAHLLGVLKHMPQITQTCVGTPFTIPAETMDKIQCAADIVALTAIVAQLIIVPENVVGTVNGIKSMITLIPQTISDCTGAFNHQSGRS